MALILKVVGSLVFLIGLLLHALNLCGYFLESDRLELHRRIERAETIPRDAPGFEKFLDAFPPPRGSIRAEQVTHIRSSNIIGGGGVSDAVNIRYMAGEKVSGRVAGLYQVAEWSKETRYDWLSWWLTLGGFSIGLWGEILGWRKGRGVS